MYLTWAPGLVLCVATTYLALSRASTARVVTAQLALPAAAVMAALTACGGWRVVLGAHAAVVVPHFTAWVSPLVLIAAHGAAAVALAVLGSCVRSAYGRR